MGNVQKMVFQETDAPPITDKDFPKFNEPSGVFEENSLTVPELLAILERNQLNSDSNKKIFLDPRIAASIPTIKIIQKEREWYVGKPKGALQIAFEKGFCNKKSERNRIKVSAYGRELEEDNLNKFTTKQLTVKELKEKLEANNLSSTGRKDNVVNRCTENNPLVTNNVCAKTWREYKYL